MAGRRCHALTAKQIARLKEVQKKGDGARPYSVPQLKLAMGGAAHFKYETLQRALDGKPVWEMTHSYIVQWLDRFFPEKPVKVDDSQSDRKTASTGEHEEVIS